MRFAASSAPSSSFSVPSASAPSSSVPSSPSVVPSSSVSAAPLPSTSSALFPSSVGFPITVDETGTNANRFSSHKNRRGVLPSEANSQQRLRPFEGSLRNCSAELSPHGRFIAVPPTENAQREEQKETQKRRNSSDKSEGGEGIAVAIQQKVFENYHLVAYSLVIVTYLLAFCEYLYLRLLSLIFPEPLVYRRNCEKHHFEILIRNEIHFASGCAVFLVMSVYQLFCFFLLTVSSRFMEIKRTFSHVVSIEQRLRHEMIFAVQRTMFATLYPTFAIYLMCSAVILCSIFYMVGLRDPIVHVGSRVIIYLFDLFVLLYLLAFPVLCVLFHPDINCRGRLVRFFCWRNRKSESAGQQNSAGESKRTVTNLTEQMGTNSASDGTSEFIGQTENNGGRNEKMERGRPFQIGGIVHSVPAKMESMAAKGNEFGGEKSGEFATVPTTQQPMAHWGGSVANYGSLERRRPWGTLLTRNFETETMALPTGTSVSIRAIRQRRRGDKYRRLRGGSDESAECRQNATNDAKTKMGTETEETDRGGADKTAERRPRDGRRHAEKRAEQKKAAAWEDAGTVSC
ncbi:hypothetical protein niasHS_002692 [Heterodera schachtii]|uniref:Uncharacterized protein n=1 Tax=Heterodera schachtii TaxID=97005 RepID=A0ABD2K262_HETSC